MSYRMGIWLRVQYVESCLVLLGLATLALSLGNLSSRGQVCNVDKLLVLYYDDKSKSKFTSEHQTTEKIFSYF